jgi:hypothetical protein
MNSCGNCGNLNPFHAKFCKKCGSKLPIYPADVELLEVAKKYAGFLTKSVVVFELKTELEIAEVILERFCSHGEVHKVVLGSSILYDFPSARNHLNQLQNQLIGILMQHERPISKARLIAGTKVPTEALDEALLDLERKGTVSRDAASDSYKLRLLE